MNVTTTQEKFLSNERNKVRLITLLIKKFGEVNIIVKQAPDDADRLIVQTALEQSCKTVVIMADDIDVLVILTALAPLNVTIYFLKLGKGKAEKQHLFVQKFRQISML